MADHLTLSGQLADQHRRSTVVALRNDAIVIAKDFLTHGQRDEALRVLEFAAERVARLERAS